MKSILSSMSSITKSVSKSSGTLVKAAQLRINLANEKENLRSIHIEMGEKICEMYAEGHSLGTFFDQRYQYVVELEGKISELQRQISESKE